MSIERKHREEARGLLGFESPRPHDHDQSPHDHLAHQWLETGDENNLMGPLRRLPVVAQALADRDARIGELEKTRQPVHYVSYASQPYVRITCTSRDEYVYDGPEQRGLSPGVHHSDGGLYSFERGPVTCPQCWLAEGVSYDECMSAHFHTKARLARVVGALREQTRLTAIALADTKNFAERCTLETIRFPALEAVIVSTNVLLKEIDDAK